MTRLSDRQLFTDWQTNSLTACLPDWLTDYHCSRTRQRRCRAPNYEQAHRPNHWPRPTLCVPRNIRGKICPSEPNGQSEPSKRANQTSEQTTNQPTKQPTNHTNNQARSSINQPIKQPMGQPNQLINRPTNEPTEKIVSQTKSFADQSTYQPINRQSKSQACITAVSWSVPCCSSLGKVKSRKKPVLPNVKHVLTRVSLSCPSLRSATVDFTSVAYTVGGRCMDWVILVGHSLLGWFSRDWRMRREDNTHLGAGYPWGALLTPT